MDSAVTTMRSPPKKANTLLVTTLDKAKESRQLLHESLAETRVAEDEFNRTVGRTNWLSRKEQKTLAELRTLENRLQSVQDQQWEYTLFKETQADKIADAERMRNAYLADNRKMVRDTRVRGAINRMATLERNQRIFRSGKREQAELRERHNAWLADLNLRNAGLKATVTASHDNANRNVARIHAERMDSYCEEAKAKAARFRAQTEEKREIQAELIDEEAQLLARIEALTARCWETNEELADTQNLTEETKRLVSQTQTWSQTSRSGLLGEESDSFAMTHKSSFLKEYSRMMTQ